MGKSGGDIECRLDVLYIEITSLQLSGSLLLNFIRFTSFSTMTILHLLTISIFFLGIRTHSVPYENVRLAFSTSPRLIYAASESNPALNGYSYTTQDINGDGSNVVFATGANSVNRLRNEMNSPYKANIMKILEKYSQEDILDKTQKNLASSQQQSKFEEAEASTNKQEDYDLDIEISNKEENLSKQQEMKNSFVDHQAPLHQLSLVGVPYPAFRSNPLSLHFPTANLPRYQIAQNVIQNQNYPHNLYARLGLPLHKFEFYNPIGPLSLSDSFAFRQIPIIIPANNLRHSSTTVGDMKVSAEQGIAESSRINATVSESSSITSDTIESRFNLASVGDKVNKTSLNESIKNELESTSEKIEEEITTNESVNSTVESVNSTMESVNSTVEPKNSAMQITQNKTDNTEVASIKEQCACMKKSDPETSTASMTEMQM